MNVVGIDLSNEAITYAKQKSEISGLKNTVFLQGDERIIKEQYESILCLGVIHGTERGERDLIINQFYKNIKSRGFCILSCFADTDPVYSKTNASSFHGIKVELLSENDIAKLLSKFKIVNLSKKCVNDYHDTPHQHHQWICIAQKT